MLVEGYNIGGFLTSFSFSEDLGLVDVADVLKARLNDRSNPLLAQGFHLLRWQGVRVAENQTKLQYL